MARLNLKAKLLFLSLSLSKTCHSECLRDWCIGFCYISFLVISLSGSLLFWLCFSYLNSHFCQPSFPLSLVSILFLLFPSSKIFFWAIFSFIENPEKIIFFYNSYSQIIDFCLITWNVIC